MKILDLNHPPKFTDNLQKNVLLLKKIFNKKFIIKDSDLEFPVYLYEIVEQDNPKMKYYSLIYNEEERYDWLLPFKIVFLDTIAVEKNNNCYIANIHKKDNISGSIMVTFVLKLLKLLHVEKAYLHDGANIQCANSDFNIDLSFFKLLEKGITFYQKFGFNFYLAENNSDLLLNFGSLDNMMKSLKNDLKNIHRIKIKYYRDAYIKILDIIKESIKNQDYENVKIYLHHPYKPYLVKPDKVKEHLLSTIRDIDSLLHIIKGSKRIYLTELMVDLLYKDCNSYLKMEDLIFRNMFKGIKYRGKGIILKHHKIFRNLMFIRNNAIFEITLN